MSEENQVENTETEATADQAASLSVQDLAVMVNVIDACSKRGAFKPSEMETVGALYSKIVNFLVASGAIKVDEPEIEEATADEETNEAAE